MVGIPSIERTTTTKRSLTFGSIESLRTIGLPNCMQPAVSSELDLAKHDQPESSEQPLRQDIRHDLIDPSRTNDSGNRYCMDQPDFRYVPNRFLLLHRNSPRNDPNFLFLRKKPYNRPDRDNLGLFGPDSIAAGGRSREVREWPELPESNVDSPNTGFVRKNTYR